MVFALAISFDEKGNGTSQYEGHFCLASISPNAVKPSLSEERLRLVYSERLDHPSKFVAVVLLESMIMFALHGLALWTGGRHLIGVENDRRVCGCGRAVIVSTAAGLSAKAFATQRAN